MSRAAVGVRHVMFGDRTFHNPSSPRVWRSAHACPSRFCGYTTHPRPMLGLTRQVPLGYGRVRH